MNSKFTRVSLELQPSLNRSLTYTVFPLGKPFYFSVVYHKQTPALQFQLDSNNSVIKDKSVMIKMFRNLETSDFANTFLDLYSELNDDNDYRCKFKGLKENNGQYLIEFMREKYDFHVSEGPKSVNNYLMILGYKIHGIEDDLNFFFVQRKSRNNITRVNTIRTAGLQIYTQKGLDVLDSYKIVKSEKTLDYRGNSVTEHFINNKD